MKMFNVSTCSKPGEEYIWEQFPAGSEEEAIEELMEMDWIQTGDIISIMEAL